MTGISLSSTLGFTGRSRISEVGDSIRQTFANRCDQRRNSRCQSRDWRAQGQESPPNVIGRQPPGLRYSQQDRSLRRALESTDARDWGKHKRKHAHCDSDLSRNRIPGISAPQEVPGPGIIASCAMDLLHRTNCRRESGCSGVQHGRLRLSTNLMVDVRIKQQMRGSSRWARQLHATRWRRAPPAAGLAGIEATHKAQPNVIMTPGCIHNSAAAEPGDCMGMRLGWCDLFMCSVPQGITGREALSSR